MARFKLTYSIVAKIDVLKTEPFLEILPEAAKNRARLANLSSTLYLKKSAIWII